MSDSLRDEDVTQIVEHGLEADEVRRQLRLFQRPPQPPTLDRPCTVGDGIRRLGEAEVDAVLPAFDRARSAGRMMKFVPASGAATRMFQSLLAVRQTAAPLSREVLRTRAAEGDRAAHDVLRLMDALPACPFFDSLQAAMATDPAVLARAGRVGEILDHLIDYAALPKGLLEFHRYPEGARTAFEEHLVEAAATVRDANGICRLHFTVSPEHEARFQELLERVRPVYERRYDARIQVTFSTQPPSTDTVAVDLDNALFRDADGRMLFRPGGHGSLIENLNRLRADVIFVKTIDNLQRDRVKQTTIRWKRALAGLLVSVQEQVWAHVRRLRRDASSNAVGGALGFARDTLGLNVSPVVERDSERLRAAVFSQLDRPMRVCGVVRNTGEPGGGPFWVRAADATCTRQIVEQAEVDAGSATQQQILKASTHFNPVDLVCGVRDDRGEPFDLHRFVNQEAVFIARKSKDGQPLKALERPGLWNGGMADWITVFVEVPIDTFSPVKTVLDFLRPEHRVEDRGAE